MIKANELRSGNRLLYGGKEITIDIQILYSLFVDGLLLPEKLEPIPLTIEWLERCLLIEKGLDLSGDLKFTGEGNLTIGVNEGKVQKYWLPFYKRREISYLHELQNVFFDLTGEELIIKPLTGEELNVKL